MAKQKKKRKTNKCPESFNSLINIAGGIAMHGVASHMEKKYHYSQKGKINPYEVSAFGIASGHMKSTEDILKTGALLGALGSFDVEEEQHTKPKSYIPEDPLFRQIHEPKKNDNRYAWRTNCTDGSTYGISPEDYETRQEYEVAIRTAESGNDKNVAKTEMADLISEDAGHSEEKYLFVRISRLDNGANQYYIAENNDINVGDTVTVPTENGTAKGIVLVKAWYSREDAPQDPNLTARVCID